MIFTNNAIHTGHHITPQVISWTCAMVVPLRSHHLSEYYSSIIRLSPYLIVIRRVIPLVLDVYGVLLKFNFMVIKLS